MTLTKDPRTADPGRDVEALIPEARELHRRRWRRRGAGGLLAAGLLAGGVALINGGGGGGSLASVGVHGPLPAGIAARAPDPVDGFGWGTRVVHTTGYTCVQLGRLRGGQLGLFARDGLAGDNGRFYPMGPSTSYQARCARNDGGGHAYMTVELGAQPASGAGGGYTGESMCQTAAEATNEGRFRAAIKQRATQPPAASSPSMPVCPAGDLRFVQYGLLGPNATSVTYRISGASQTEQAGPDGAYLIVGPSTPAFCGQLARETMCGAAGVAPNSIGGGMIETVHYRNAPPCQVNRASSHLPAFAVSCPHIGYIPAKPKLTDRKVVARDPRPRDQSQRLLPEPRKRADQRIQTRARNTTRAVSPMLEPDAQPSGRGHPRHARDLLLDRAPTRHVPPEATTRSSSTMAGAAARAAAPTDKSPPGNVSPAA